MKRCFKAPIRAAFLFAALLCAYAQGTAGPVGTPPVITAQPQNLAVLAGGGFTLRVEVATTNAFSCQWTHNGQNLGGATNSSLSYSSVTTNQAGTYQVIVTNSFGATFSSNATVWVLLAATQAVTRVPATGDPWLAGMPTGSTALYSDVAPQESPAQVTNVPVLPGSLLFFSVTGVAAHGPGASSYGPDGYPFAIYSHSQGGENGIADILTPMVSLIGVFLSNTEPDFSSAPEGLDFSTGLSEDYTAFQPDLKQPFFIGDGLNSAGLRQCVIVPPGAARLYLGIMDGYDWYDNNGDFQASITVAAPPQTTAILVQPGSQTVITGSSVELRVAAAGTPPLVYQWQRNGVALHGATGPVLLLTNSSPAMSGLYTVVVSNSFGSTVSDAASISIGNLSFVSQPNNENLVAGDQTVLTGLAVGDSPVSYQWIFSNPDVGWQAVPSGTSSSLPLGPVTLAITAPHAWAGYALVASNSFGSITSSVATVSVFPASPESIPLAATGWNSDVILENTNGAFADSFDNYSADAWFESGYQLDGNCLPPSRLLGLQQA